jgi:hypothetical protein
MDSSLKSKDIQIKYNIEMYVTIKATLIISTFVAREVTSRSAGFTPPPTASVTNGHNLGSVRSSPSLVGRSPVRQPKTNSDDELFKFLNSSEQPVNSMLEEVSYIDFLTYFLVLQAFLFLMKPSHFKMWFDMAYTTNWQVQNL